MCAKGLGRSVRDLKKSKDRTSLGTTPNGNPAKIKVPTEAKVLEKDLNRLQREEAVQLDCRPVL